MPAKKTDDGGEEKNKKETEIESVYESGNMH